MNDRWWVDWMERLLMARLPMDRLRADVMEMQRETHPELSPAQQAACDLIDDATKTLSRALEVMGPTPGWEARRAEIARDVAKFLSSGTKH